MLLIKREFLNSHPVKNNVDNINALLDAVQYLIAAIVDISYLGHRQSDRKQIAILFSREINNILINLIGEM